MSRRSVFEEMFRTACKRSAKTGHGQSERGNRMVSVDGEYRPVWTFLGIIPRLHGIITCVYYSSKIFAIDFINNRVTNFGMSGYSMSTGQNLHGWEDVCASMFPHLLEKWKWKYGEWVDRNTLPDVQTMYGRFCAKVPWIYVDKNDVRWFEWDKFDEALAQVYHRGCDFLREDQNWRYFDYDWDNRGDWTVKYKDDDAQRRYMQRERQRARAQKKAA